MKSNKLFLVGIVFLVLLSFNVFALRASISVISPSTIEFTSNSPVSTIATVKVENDGQNALSAVELTGSVSGPSTVPDAQLVTVTNIAVSQSKSGDLTFSFPRTSRPGSYTLTVSAKDVDTGATVQTTRTITVTQSPAFEVLKSGSTLSELNLKGEPSTETRFALSIKNTGNVDLTNLRLSQRFTDLTDDDDDKITLTLTPATINSLTVGSTTNFEVLMKVESGFDPDELSGLFAVESSQFSEKTLPFKIEVNPLTCLSTSSSQLSIDIEEPNDDQDFDPGETVKVRVDVANDGTDDVRARVQALLFDLDNGKRVDSDTTEQRVKEDDEESVFFEFLLDSSDFDEDTNLRLYIKTFEKGSEETTCVEDSVDLNVQIPDHKVDFDSLTLTPQAVSCGSSVSVNAVVKNSGSSLERTLVRVDNAALGLSLVSGELRLPDDRDDDDNVQSASLSFRVPENAKNGNYPLDVSARYSGKTTNEQVVLIVSGCGSQTSSSTSQDTSGSTSVSVGSSSDTDATSYTGSVVADKTFWENLQTEKVPTLVWVLVDVVAVLAIISLLVYLFRRR